MCIDPIRAGELRGVRLAQPTVANSTMPAANALAHRGVTTANHRAPF